MKIILNLILLALLNICRSTCEKYTLEDYPLSSNSVNNFKRFIYNKYTFHNASLQKSGFSYNLTLNYTNKYTEGESFHLYIIQSDIIPHFDLLNNPAICCSAHGGVICDDSFNANNPRSQETEYKLLKNHSIYYKDVNLSRSEGLIKIDDINNFNTEGVFYSIFLVCSPKDTSNKNQNDTLISTEDFSDYSQIIFLNGYFSFFNSFGYLSAEEFFSVDLYLFLSLYYFIFSLYWVYKLIIKNSGMNFFSKMLTLIIPVIIIEKMMNLQIYSEINKWGELNIAFHSICIICNVIKNVVLRIILYGIAIGYSYTTINYNQISKKKILNFSLIIIAYLISLVVYLIIYSKYTF